MPIPAVLILVSSLALSAASMHSAPPESPAAAALSELKTRMAATATPLGFAPLDPKYRYIDQFEWVDEWQKREERENARRGAEILRRYGTNPPGHEI